MSTNNTAIARKNRREIMNEKNKRPRIYGSSSCINGESQGAANSENSNEPISSKRSSVSHDISSRKTNETEPFRVSRQEQHQHSSHEPNSIHIQEAAYLTTQTSSLTNIVSESNVNALGQQKENSNYKSIIPEGIQNGNFVLASSRKRAPLSELDINIPQDVARCKAAENARLARMERVSKLIRKRNKTDPLNIEGSSENSGGSLTELNHTQNSAVSIECNNGDKRVEVTEDSHSHQLLEKITKKSIIAVNNSEGSPSATSTKASTTKRRAQTNSNSRRSTTRPRHNNTNSIGYYHMGFACHECEHCDALFWYDERAKKDFHTSEPKYNLCCRGGQIELPTLQQAPKVLYDLLFSGDTRSKHFKENIRNYNTIFQFTSMGAKVDRGRSYSRGPPTFVICGENYHLMGSLLPPEGASAKFCQLYVFDTNNEIQNRMSVMRGEASKSMHEDIVRELKNMLDENNVLVKVFRMVRESLTAAPIENVRLRLIGKRGKDGRRYNLPTANEVAALVVGDFDMDRTDRDIIVETQSGRLQRINQLNPAYLGLQYPLIFPYGEDGFREGVLLNKVQSTSEKGREKLTLREFLCYRIQERLADGSALLYSRRLFQQFLVDGYSMVESSRLNYIRLQQKKLRIEMYSGLTEVVLNGETSPSSRGKRIVLPSTFTGGPRYMIQNYQDAMAICKVVGYPDLFITLTCNPKWPELEDFLKSRELNPEDRPDMVCRAFKVKLDHLIKDIKNNRVFGRVVAVVYTIEFQKRGLPHAHILVFLHPDDKYPTPEDIDRIISAEIPNKEEDPEYFEAVESHMMHGPCGAVRKESPCMENGACIRHFPKRFVESTTIDEDGYPVYRRRDNGRTISKSGVDLDNRYVVPHNRELLIRYGAHINVEWCNQTRSIKYLFKYVNKGNDRVTALFYKSGNNSGGDDHCDEVSMYYDCRYISPCEAAWRIFAYNIHFREPSVVRLGLHLENEQPVVFEDSEWLDDVANKESVKESMFLGWMSANEEYTEARSLTYAEFPTKFVWNAKRRFWSPRKSHSVVGRIFFVPPGSGDLYYLRLLLNIVRGPKSYEEIRTVDGIVYESYKDACYARGLLEDDKEYIDAIEEASHWGSGDYLRKLFATMLFSNSMSRPDHVWNKTWPILCEDILPRQRRLLNHPELHMEEGELKELALIEIENILRSCNKSLKDFHPMPIPNMELGLSCQMPSTLNKLICDELRYDRRQLANEHAQYMQQLTNEQKGVYEQIINSVNSGKGGAFFLYGYGGTGKTFVWKTLAASLRSKGHIVLTVASSGIASLLLPGGRTAHSRFAIPVDLDEFSTCNIKQGSHMAELLVRCKLIIWDEAPMVNRNCIEALDRTMRDILRFKNNDSLNTPFGGKTIVFGGDFRQILPVVPKGSRQDIVNATINSSYLWDSCKILTLTRNMRLERANDPEEQLKLEEFANWVLSIGDGKCGVEIDGTDRIRIPDEFLIKDYDDPIVALCRETFPEMFEQEDAELNMQDRAILAPTLKIVDEINNFMMTLNKHEAQTYYSSDKASPTEPQDGIFASIHTPEFLNTIRCSGVPNHELTLKVGTPVMLLRNIDHSAGLCNGTRLVITKLGKHVIEAKTMSGSKNGEKVFIPRMTLTPSDHRIPFKFQRRQFPIMVSYAMTINKSQGQSLSKVGLYLKKPVFTHGQLYVAMSRVTNRGGLKIMLCDEELSDCETDNVVYKEVFRNVG